MDVAELIGLIPGASKALADHEKKKADVAFAARKELVKKRADLALSAEQEMAAAQAAVERAAAVQAAAAKAFTEAQELHRKAHWGRHNASARNTPKLESLERELRATAPPEIAAFIQEMTVLSKELPPVTFLDTFGPDMMTVTARKIRISNRESVFARRDAINQAIVEADKLTVLAVAPAELSKRLQALRDSIPEVQPPSVSILGYERASLNGEAVGGLYAKTSEGYIPC